MLTIWGRANSINVQKVLWCCTELGLDYERHDLGGVFGGLDAEAYLAMNPNGKIPVVQDGDLILWESHAILRYLGGRYGVDVLWPADPVERAPMDAWLDWAHTEAYAVMRNVFFQLIRTAPEDRDPELLAEGMRQLPGKMAILDRVLADRPFLLGERFSLADIPIALVADRWFKLVIARTQLPHLETYYDRVRERRAYQLHAAASLT